MEIKYWSDIACPFCYIGSHNMKQALKDLGLIEQVPFKMLAYQLDPVAPEIASQSTQKVIPQIKQIEELAHQSGLEINLADAKHVNTMDAHRLIKLAYTKSDEVANRLMDKLYRLYFVKGESVADSAVLTKTAIEADLDIDDIEAVLNSNKFKAEVKKDEMTASRIGIKGVPIFVINNKYALHGGQSYEVMVTKLEKIANNE